MKTVRNIPVPTGNILIVEGSRGLLECLSLGDYGKDVNLNQHRKVEHTDLLPLSEKWVCTISTQYGCSSGCRFCDVPRVGKGVNATFEDLIGQVEVVRALHPKITRTSRFNIHYARMGEPSWNPAVLESAKAFANMPGFHVHPVVSTMLPCKNKNLKKFISEWCRIKNEVYSGEAGLQLSINSTSEYERAEMFRDSALELEQISELMQDMPKPRGRKYTLNFAIADYEIHATYLADLFSPDDFVVKLTPMHKTKSALESGIETSGDYTEAYPYEEAEDALKRAGFETLVFIASKEEDESRITCGNAVLALGTS